MKHYYMDLCRPEHAMLDSRRLWGDALTGCVQANRRQERNLLALSRSERRDVFDCEFEALIKNEPGSGLVLAY